MVENCKVSVCMITYNHEPFIIRAIDSVLMQKTKFEYEIVVGDDCSTDKTQRILEGYKNKYPDIIRLILNGKNIGSALNYQNTFLSCAGYYVALLEGDDYWIDPLKLQKQVDEFELHPDCTICGHLTKIENRKGEYRGTFGPSPIFHGVKNIYKVEDVIRGLFIHTSAVMVKNHTISQFPAWFKDCITSDFIIQILHASRGDICFLRDTMSVYNVNPASIWSHKSALFRIKNTRTAYHYADAALDYKYHTLITYVMVKVIARFGVSICLLPCRRLIKKARNYMSVKKNARAD